jgi:glycosyltransferase involved in cell wall biosynthesis
MEAGAMGLVIVTTNVGELSYLWSNKENALSVSLNDAVTMAKAVQRVLTDPGPAEKLSRNARKNAERFDWLAILPQWERLINQVVEEHEKR